MKLTNAVILAASTMQVAALIPDIAFAQTADVQRNIDQNQIGKTPSREPEKPRDEVEFSSEPSFSIGKLIRVEVNSPYKRAAIEQYFSKSIGSAIPAEEIERFKGWAWSLVRERGYLAFITTETRQEGEGTVLIVNVIEPVVGQIRLSDDTRLEAGSEKQILSRFSKIVRRGKPLDLQFLEHRISSANYDLPVHLRATVQQSDAGTIDVVLHATRERDDANSRGAFVQVNNYGLRRYGRVQYLASVRAEGLTTNSQVTVTGVKSKGINYVRADYDTPVSLLSGRVNLWTSFSDSHGILKTSTETKGRSFEYGIGYASALETTRSEMLRGSIELIGRNTKSRLSSTNQVVDSYTDRKVRITASLDNAALARDHYEYELSTTLGHNKTFGSYMKHELKGKTARSLSADGTWVTTLRFNGQITSDILDGYDKLYLGGINGVRAYSTNDGVGDKGAVGSIDLFKHLTREMYIGAFYDLGWIANNSSRKVPKPEKSYTLQGAGIQMGGQVGKNFSYAVALAKGLGSYRGYVRGNVESSPRNWRFLIAVTGRF